MPSGFSLVSTVSVAERGHVGTRTTYRGPHGRSLVVLAGIAGEVGEGGTVVARPRLVRGGRARMYRAGPRLILAWRETGPCADRGVIGERLDRPSFLDAMSAAGIVET
jgi:hypothetical protein